MNIVDSSAWLEYLVDTKNANNFQSPIEDIENLIVPSIVMYEVFKKTFKERGKEAAIEAVGQMHQGKIIGVHTNAALTAARFSMEHNLAMADALILAIAKQAGATLWTQDKDFKGLEGVKYFKKK
jgi:toxin FitB